MGVPSVFVRASGCNLRCTWCDTPYASWNANKEASAAEKTVAEVVADVLGYRAEHVVITGGEPMMFHETATLIGALKDAGKHITVETAGTLWLDDLEKSAANTGRPPIDLASISPKLANSTPTERDGGRFAIAHERQRINLDVLRAFAGRRGNAIAECQWKFVVARPEDLKEIDSLLAGINTGLPPEHHIPKRDVLLMPEGIDSATLAERSGWLAELCKSTGYRFCPRLHILLYGNRRGT